MIKLYEVCSNFYRSEQNGKAIACCLPTKYHGLYLTKCGAIKKLNKIVEDLCTADYCKHFEGSHKHMAIFPVDSNGFVIQNYLKNKEKMYGWVRYHIGVLDLTNKNYLEELQ